MKASMIGSQWSKSMGAAVSEFFTEKKTNKMKEIYLNNMIELILVQLMLN